MKKLALAVDSLVVESFPVSAAPDRGGTVVANEMATVGISCAPTCPAQFSCDTSCC